MSQVPVIRCEVYKCYYYYATENAILLLSFQRNMTYIRDNKTWSLNVHLSNLVFAVNLIFYQHKYWF